MNPVIEANVLTALRKSREQRYQTAGEFARDIECYLSGRPTLAAGDVGGSRAKLVLAGAVAAAVVVAVGLTLLVVHGK